MTDMRNALTALKAANPDVIVGCVYQTTCITMIEMMKELDFSPKVSSHDTLIVFPSPSMLLLLIALMTGHDGCVV
jgi:hypothetical protein